MSDNLQGTELLQFLQEASVAELRAALNDIHPADILDALEDYKGDAIAFLAKLPNEILADIIEEAEEEDKSGIFDLFPLDQKKEIISEMASDELADLLVTIDPDEANDLIDSLDAEDAQDVKDLMQYDPETAGGIMATEFMTVKDNMTVRETLEYLQKYGEDAETLGYLYVLDEHEVLKGVVSLRDIVVHKFNEAIAPLIKGNVISVKPELDQEEVASIFQKYGFTSMPVVDDEDRMLGIITADDVLDVVVDESTEDFEKMAAIAHSDGEYLETGVFELARKRIFWLLFLMISATFTSVIIQNYESALASIVILAAFIPMLMDTGGNAGSQSATLIIRGMALGEIAIKDYFLVIFKEIRVSLIVGVVLAVVNFLRIWLFNNDILLAMTVSLSLLFTVVLAKTVGCTLPIVARKFRIDPAIMAAPIITTIVDVLSLLVYFKLAVTFYKII
ncbi:MAG: magnesium transporter [Candidatus Cloacimonetes bacterium]|jgi:magnesium transporter|nr:magnesium transporter [Candidatus Cloacimonadota bacterium]MCK9183864.1 magnesium transporter [Candidatus Cloacimonadota bacterium]MCK9583906.1 magnesium transporter [Candidatus Cloacimonadota bacterium]